MTPLLTWSGVASHEIAKFFREWLPTILPGVSPWVSSQDIAKGSHWFKDLESQLDKTRLSITFVTPENIRSPWVYYEVGFVAAKLLNGRVCPFLVNVEDKFVRDTPLGQYQWTKPDKDDVLKLILAINEEMDEAKHSPQLVEDNFKAQWPKLKREIDKIKKSLDSIVDESVEATELSVEEQLSEEARHLLVEAAKSNDGTIIFDEHLDELELIALKENIIENADARTLALWRSALKELVDFELVRDERYEGRIFPLTKAGFDAADRIKGRS